MLQVRMFALKYGGHIATDPSMVGWKNIPLIGKKKVIVQGESRKQKPMAEDAVATGREALAAIEECLQQFESVHPRLPDQWPAIRRRLYKVMRTSFGVYSHNDLVRPYDLELLDPLLARIPGLAPYRARIMNVARLEDPREHGTPTPRNLFDTLPRHMSRVSYKLLDDLEFLLENPRMLEATMFRGRPIQVCMRDVLQDPFRMLNGVFMAIIPGLRDQPPITYTPPPIPDYTTIRRPTRGVADEAYKALAVESNMQTGLVEWAGILGVQVHPEQFTYDHALELATALSLPEHTHMKLLKANFTLACDSILSEAFAHTPLGWAKANIPIICANFCLLDQHRTSPLSDEVISGIVVIYGVFTRLVQVLGIDLEYLEVMPPRKAARHNPLIRR